MRECVTMREWLSAAGAALMIAFGDGDGDGDGAAAQTRDYRAADIDPALYARVFDEFSGFHDAFIGERMLDYLETHRARLVGAWAYIPVGSPADADEFRAFAQLECETSPLEISVAPRDAYRFVGIDAESGAVLLELQWLGGNNFSVSGNLSGMVRHGGLDPDAPETDRLRHDLARSRPVSVYLLYYSDDLAVLLPGEPALIYALARCDPV